MQLGVAVATGTTWMGSGRGWASRQGRALMLFAEEDADEVQRRRYYAIKAAGILSDDDLPLSRKTLC
jgi:RecA-family ATPase